MTQQELEDLKTEALAAHAGDIDRYKKDAETVEWFVCEGWQFSDIRELLPLGRIKEFYVSVARLASKPQVVCVILVAAMTFEALHLHPALEPAKIQFTQEYSNFDLWKEQAARNANTPLIYGFVEIRKIPPHVPEEGFQQAPQSTVYAQLTGSSPTVSGQYYHG